MPVLAKSSYKGVLLDVVTPSTINVLGDNDQFIQVTILGPLYNEFANTPCKGSEGEVEKRCAQLSFELNNSPLGVVIEKYNGPKLLGDIVYKGKLLSMHMIEQGWYRVDNTATSSIHLFEAEKQAYCSYKGLWKKNIGKHEVTAKCMRR
jgi:hypothetical protein